jgi:hypothetical protein
MAGLEPGHFVGWTTLYWRLARPTSVLAPIAITNSTSSTAYIRGMSKLL